MTETKVNPEDNLDDEGQVNGKHGQTNGGSTSNGSQLEEDLVELSDGEKVTLEELKKGYMKDADYRKKTADVASERERVAHVLEQAEVERRARESNEEPEEVNPIAILDDRLNRMEANYARDYLRNEIDRMSGEFSEADKRAVFDSCWNNPNAIIKDEMRRSHENINERITKRSTDIDTLLKDNPELDAKLSKKYIDAYNAKKKLKTEVATGTGAGGGETVVEGEEKVITYKKAGSNLREKLKTQGSEEL